MQIEVVIGANYGDEGKGLFTEYLCRNRPKSLVIMSNGGCQRGHTIYNKEHRVRHIFHHFGSGTLVGAPTIFSKTFLLNPIAFVNEYNELHKLNVLPDVARSLGCILQLPSDMFINQQLEKHRSMSGNKHGSCGWGIWETIVRNRHYKQLSFEDFLEMSLDNKKKYINDALEWQIENRLKCENGLKIDENILKIIQSDGFINHFISDFCFMEKQCPLTTTNDLVEYAENSGYNTIIVENAQGLLLNKKYAPKDENGRTDIHSTPSKTGLDGAIEALNSTINYNDVIANYITRSYMTRHGAGPFPEETSNIHFDDKTNIPNDYQDSLRFGKITFDVGSRLFDRIKIDSKDVNYRLVVTHLNEMRCGILEENANYFSYEDDSSKIEARKINT